MHVLDFLNASPHNYIFQKSSNKTNFGGVCFFLCIITIIIMGIYFIVDYKRKDYYSIDYSSFKFDMSIKGSNIQKTIKFHYDLSSQDLYSNNKPLSKSFSFMNKNTNLTIPRNVTLSEDIENFDYLLVYECPDDECNIQEEVYPDYIYSDIGYEEDCFNLQEDNPLYKCNSRIRLTISFRIFNTILVFFEDTIITTKELFGEKNVSFTSPKNYYVFPSQINMTIEQGNKKYKPLGEIIFGHNFMNHEHYTRTKKSFMDTLSSICSLAMTIFNTIKTGFLLLYSNNFDNYKIVQSLFYNNETKLKKNIKKIKKLKSLDNPDHLLNNNNNINDDEISEQNIGNEKIETNSEEQNNELDIYFPKLSFVSFIFNFFYCQNCCNMKKQLLLYKCNEIISKYYSIDNIIKNQIRIEHLLKDYKWNNSELKKLESNELLYDLKKLCEDI